MNASDSSSSSFSSSRQRAKQHELICPWEKKKVGGGHLSFLSSLLTNEMGLRPFLFLFFNNTWENKSTALLKHIYVFIFFGFFGLVRLISKAAEGNICLIGKMMHKKMPPICTCSSVNHLNQHLRLVQNATLRNLICLISLKSHLNQSALWIRATITSYQPFQMLLDAQYEPS